MDRVGQRTKCSLLTDFIHFRPKPHAIKAGVLRELYLEKGLSSNQIAAELGVCKSAILTRLRAIGVREKAGSKTNPENYRHHEPPYGYRVQDGKLVPNKKELLICRLVIELRTRKGWALAEIASELTKRGYVNRRGAASWHHHSVNQIFKRWNGKL